MMFQFVNDEDPIAAHMSVMVMVELYRKGAWQDRKTVNVMAAACLSPHMKVVVAALQFFLGIDNQLIMDREEEKGGDDGHEELVAAQMAQRVGKKTKSKARQVDRVRHAVKKENRRQGADDVGTANFSALHLINDPQGLAEKLFTNLKKYVACTHTLIWWCVLLACHEIVPPDTVEQMITALANNFVTERCSSEVMTVGLNSIRGMCTRSPLAMSSTLMSDLAEYKSYKDKSVMMAARALIGLFRDINPEVLPKKDRGFAASTEGYTAANYGETRVADHVPGAEYLKQPGDESSDEEPEEDGWDSDDSFENGDIEGDWVKVHDGDDRPIDDGEKKAPMTQEEMVASRDAAKLASVSRVFTEDDFKRIKRGKVEAAMLGNNSKRKRGAEDTSNFRRHDEIVDVNDIEKLSKRQKMDKEARRETVLEGRVDREKYMSKRARRKAIGEVGMTQKENSKKKNFLMVSRSFAVHSKKTIKQVEKIRQNRASRKKNSKMMRK
ncbi:hypothetical protein SARC_03721 [Sphaeroforma arctica JP610]|uniref:Protein SDA1 n=1 Tax=Sphaeroforma arctica JP610 TaxID=667725 RepID=A0A0L0G586_9EUKA|nr:hypothetical protein SARC_03721 [Sphaeroforma arctica JP610]KNC84059.1 hypothetical protein SARC_03721 [Sphaeroforma arctica JP610]|eukprot:XP_014157961.1 hypothetical protein SARC_03721 [Sphaeroforma arctica JP610]